MVTEPGGCDFLHGSSLQGTLMLFSLIHPGTGSSSQSKLDTFEVVRLIQSLFGYHHLTPSLMEAFFAEAISVLANQTACRVPNAFLAAARRSLRPNDNRSTVSS